METGINEEEQKNEEVEARNEELKLFRQSLDYLDRVETRNATRELCQQMEHDSVNCQCGSIGTVPKSSAPPFCPFFLIQPNGDVAEMRSQPIASIFVTLEKPRKYSSSKTSSTSNASATATTIPTMSKKKATLRVSVLKDNDQAKRRREIKKKLFMDLGIHRTNCGIDDKEKEREEAMKRKVTETIVTTYCELCEQNFSSSKMLLLHNSKVHETSSLECHLCLKRFNQTLTFNRHMKTHYGPNAQYLVKCELCDRKFKDKDSLTTHMNVTH